MQWLVIGLLVSLCALLLAAVGVARHIRLHRARLRGSGPVESIEPADEADIESGP